MSSNSGKKSDLDDSACLNAYITSIAYDHFSADRERILTRTTKLMVPGIMNETKKQGNPDKVYDRAYALAYEAMQVISDMDSALHPKESGSAYRSALWWHIEGGQVVSAEKIDDFEIIKSDFVEAVGQYIARPWMQHDYVDWCIVDAMVRHEWAAFHCTISESALYSERSDYPDKWIKWAFLAVFYAGLYGLLFWGIRYLYDVASSWATIVAWAVGFAVALDWITPIIRRRKSNTSKVQTAEELHAMLFEAMRLAYKALDGSALSPTRVRDALQEARDAGVIYSNVVWPIIDMAVARDPNVWRVSLPN